MELTTEQKQDWANWLAKRPENVRKVAEQIVPWKRYRDKRIVDDIGNRYIPCSYEESEHGSITITCLKVNDKFPALGGYRVFGIKAENLEED